MLNYAVIKLPGRSPSSRAAVPIPLQNSPFFTMKTVPRGT